jgi:hypothetical protein
MATRESVLNAFDRLFDRAAAKLRIECSAEEKSEARRDFAERSAAALDLVDRLDLGGLPPQVIDEMESAIDRISPAQLVGYLAAIPLAHQAQAMLRHIAHRAAEQRMIEQFISQADDTYGGN